MGHGLIMKKVRKWTKIVIIDGLKRYDRLFKPIVIANPMAHLTILIIIYSMQLIEMGYLVKITLWQLPVLCHGQLPVCRWLTC